VCYRRRPVWIGLHKSQPTRTDNCYWTDGNPSSYRNWQGNEPNSKKMCVRMIANGRHRDKRCNKKYRYVCKKEKGISVFTRVIFCTFMKLNKYFKQSMLLLFLSATSGTAIAHLSRRNFVRPSVGIAIPGSRIPESWDLGRFRQTWILGLAAFQSQDFGITKIS